VSIHRSIFVMALALGGVIAAKGAEAQTAYSVSASIGNFHVAVSNYYQVPEREVIVVRERRIPDDELPVVFFIAQRARVPVARIVDMRLRGDSWWDISVRFGLGADVYYVPVTVVRSGPPYGRAYGHYKKPKKQWNTIALTDGDVVNLVQLRFISDHYHIAPERVVEMRERNVGFIAIHDDAGKRGAAARHDDRGGDRRVASSGNNGDDRRVASSGNGGGSNAGGNGAGNGKGRGGKKQ
jgi:hypothetical protein